MKTVKKRFDINIANLEQSTPEKFELDKVVTHVKGILLTSDKDDMLYFRGTVKIEINEEEIFPENYEAKLLMSGVNVAPNQRYYDLGKIPVGNRNVKISYTDHEDSRAGFEAYRVSVYLFCETE